MNKEILNWFYLKVNQNPEWVKTSFIPAVLREIEKEDVKLHQIIRVGTLEEIKYQQGLADGVERIVSLMNGLKLSESKVEKPSGRGLIARILDRGR